MIPAHFLVLIMLFAGVTVQAASFPLASQSSSMRFELVDQLTLTSLSVSTAFDAVRSYLRYSTVSASGITTTVTPLSTFKRYTFNDVWSASCAVAGPPDVSSTDIKYAVAALVATGAAATQNGVLSKLQFANASSIRGISTTRWIALGATVAVNSSVCSLDLSWDFGNQWTMAPQGGAQSQIVAFSVTGSCGSQPLNLLGSVLWWTGATPNSLLFQAIGTCNATMPWAAAPPGATVATPAPTSAMTLFPMPTLPPAFSALVQATFAERSATFSLYESFSGSYSRSTFLWPTSAKTVIVDGGSALAYVQSTKNAGLNTAWADPTSADGTFTTRSFFSTSDTCTKTVFSYRLMSSVSDLLTLTLAATPHYMGSTLVRGIMTQYWRAITGGQTYTWYFANSSWKFPTNSSASTYAQLVRVTASGTGISPFFVAHPYLQRWLPVPTADAAYCASIMDIAPDVCNSGGQTFVHVYDFATFVPRVDPNEVAVPSACTGDTGSVVATTTDCPATMSGGSIFLLVLLSAVFGALAGGGLMYCRLKRDQKSPVEADD